jgi:hypothetical protein
VRKNTVLSSYNLAFLLIIKNYKAKLSINLILKKINKDNLEGKKPMRKNIVVINNVLWGKLQCFLQ